MLWIRAMGAATPLGALHQAMAAYRAGITRFEAAPDQIVMMEGEEEPEALNASALEASTFGFVGTGRLVALLADALQDLASRIQPWDGGPELGLFLALPDPEQRGFSLEKGPDDPFVDPPDEDERVEVLGARIVEALAFAGTPPLGGGVRRFFGGGHVAFARAIAAAEEAVEQRQVRAALVGCVDSLASADALQLAFEDDRLKTSDSATGYIPGEAAVVAWLEPRPRAGTAGPQVFVGGVQTADEPNVAEGDPLPDGRVLADLITRAAGTAGELPVVISDHDGEEVRAHELGAAQFHLVRRDKRYADARIWLPATGFGNTGAATGGLAAAAALRAVQRRYAPSPRFVVVSGDDSGDRSAFTVSVEGR